MTPYSPTNSQLARQKAEQAYHLLANGDISEHMQALRLLDEARELDAEAVMRYEHEVDQYKMLTIEAKNRTTTIYLTDEQDNLVQQEVGFMQTSVAPGTYYVYFGKKADKKLISLTCDMNVKEVDL